jgi:hypothetical protein
MASQTRILSFADGGLVQLSLTYDDVSGAIASVQLQNNSIAGSMTATLRDFSTDAVIFGPVTRTFGTGTITQDLTNLHLSMVAQAISKRAPDGWALPFNYLLSWSSA